MGSIMLCDQALCGSGPLGEDGKIADDDLDFLKETFWCCYFLIGGFGCSQNFLPIASGNASVCCLDAKLSTNTCCDDGLGCCGVHLKTCCCVADMQLPPSASVGLTCCCVECCANEARQPKMTEGGDGDFSGAE